MKSINQKYYKFFTQLDKEKRLEAEASFDLLVQKYDPENPSNLIEALMFLVTYAPTKVERDYWKRIIDPPKKGNPYGNGALNRFSRLMNSRE